MPFCLLIVMVVQYLCDCEGSTDVDAAVKQVKSQQKTKKKRRKRAADKGSGQNVGT